MDQQTHPQPRKSSGRTGRRLRPRVRIGAIVAIAIAAGFIAWATIDSGGGGGSSTSKPSTNTKGTGPVALSFSGLKTLVAALRQPVYWIGTSPNTLYELRQTSDGKIYVRYLPPGTKAGDPRPLLTVATYPMRNAFSATQATAKRGGNVELSTGRDSAGFYPANSGTNAYVAFSGSDYQIEVYDPTPGAARGFVARRTVSPVSGGSPLQARAVSPAGLKGLAASLGQPIYWAGRRPGVTYEVTQTTSGRIYVRYLGQDVPVGDARGALTVATYPFVKAFEATMALAKDPSHATIKLGNGGIAVYDKANRMNVYVAFPDTDYQIEVYDPRPGNARTLVKSGRIATVG
jgi:hypothetical protein